MNPKPNFLPLLAATALFMSVQSSPAQVMPSASDIVARVVERAAKVATNDLPAKYIYEKHSLVEELDATDHVLKSTEKTYRVTLCRGLPFARLTGVHGRQLSQSEIDQEDQKEKEFLKKVSARDLGKMAARKEAWITRGLVSRYEFKVLGIDPQMERRTIILEFKPKPANPEKSIQDRVCDRLAGQIRVDEADAEIAKLDVHLTEGFSLGWLGILGSLKECRLQLERQRVDDAVWINSKQSVEIRGRKLFSGMHYHTTDVSKNCHTEP
jgi:hypothetical protein